MFIVWGFFYFGLALLVGMFAKSKGRSFLAFFLLSLIFSPLLGFIVALIVGNEKLAQQRHEQMLAAQGVGVAETEGLEVTQTKSNTMVILVGVIAAIFAVLVGVPYIARLF